MMRMEVKLEDAALLRLVLETLQEIVAEMRLARGIVGCRVRCSTVPETEGVLTVVGVGGDRIWMRSERGSLWTTDRLDHITVIEDK